MDPISRMERILSGEALEPITRIEKFCAMAAGTYTGDPLVPTSRLEYFLSQISGGGGGGDVDIETFEAPLKSFTNFKSAYHYSNQTRMEFDAPEGVAYDLVKISDEYSSYMTFARWVEHVCTAGDMGDNRFRSMTNIKSIVMSTHSASSILQNCFYGCTSLKDLVILRPDGIQSLNNINAFASTPFASNGSGGTLWVPQNLISAYQAATNWSTIIGYTNNQIKQIEGSIWE